MEDFQSSLSYIDALLPTAQTSSTLASWLSRWNEPLPTATRTIGEVMRWFDWYAVNKGDITEEE